MTPEILVQNQIRLATNLTQGTLYRNNSGVWVDKRGVPVRYGLGNDSARLNKVLKSADLIGITPVTVGLEHVGRVFGVFTAIEVKRPGWNVTSREVAQLNFIEVIRKKGGIAAFATCPGDYLEAIMEYKNEVPR